MNTQSISSVDQRQLRETIHRLLDEAIDVAWERRSASRVPYFQPVTVSVGGDEQGQYSCFSRDISPAGIGLLHSVAIGLGEVVLTIPSQSAGPIRFRAEVVWCRPCGEGWYMSGVAFLNVLGSD
jgi:hypothetical protein